MDSIHEWIIWFIAFFLGYFCCWLAGRFLGTKRTDGLLNVDTRDPEKDFYDFVFLIPTGDIPKRKYLNIEVKTKP